VLFQKLPTRPKHLPTTDNDEVVGLSLLEEAKGTLLRQRPPNTVPPDGAFNVVKHGSLGSLWQEGVPEPRLGIGERRESFS